MTAERHNLTKKENSDRMKQLKKSFREKGYGFRNTKGKWDEGSGTQSERSIHVYAKGPGNRNAAELVKHARELSKQHQQDAFIHRSPKGTGTAVYTKPGSDGKKEKFGKTRYNTSNPYGETEYKSSKPEGSRPKFTFKD